MEAVTAYLRYYISLCLETMRKNMKNSNSRYLFPGRDSNQDLLEPGTGGLTPRLRGPVRKETDSRGGVVGGGGGEEQTNKM
jgi:hypothetical protein